MSLQAVVLLPACLNFDRVYTQYCERTGACDGGVGGTDAGADAGIQCRPFGADCDGPGQCCASDDDGELGCSPLGYCQARQRRCVSDNFACTQDSECCTGVCDNGTCRSCGRGDDSCDSNAECCFQQLYLCTQGGSCEWADGQLGDHCGNPNDCLSQYCEVLASGPVVEGTCAAPPAGCATVGTTPSGGQTCCPGTTVGSPSSSACCLADEAPCDLHTHCCGGACVGGYCQSHPNSVRGDWCEHSANCSGQAACDPVSDSCQTRWCFPRNAIKPGCCEFTYASDTCTFSDGSACRVGWFPGCSTPEQCCSGVCNAGQCELPSF